MPYHAFVSSTYEDLKAHRSHVITKLREAGIVVDPMEDWTASTDEPKVFSQDRLDGCDVCIMLVALRRGFVPPGEQLSITQLEHRAAIDKGLDVLVFMLEEDAPWSRRFDELDADPGLREWRRQLMDERGVGFFGQDPASINIGPAITRWVTEKQASGKRKAPVRTATEYRRTPWLGIEVQQRDRPCPMYGAGSGDLGVAEIIEVVLEPGPFELRIPNVGERDQVIVKAWKDDSIYEGFVSQAEKADLPFLQGAWGMADTPYGSGMLFLDAIAYHTFGRGFRADVGDQDKLRILFNRILNEDPEEEVPRQVHMVVFLNRKEQTLLERDDFEKLILNIDSSTKPG
jgi:hypothetical protein